MGKKIKGSIVAIGGSNIKNVSNINQNQEIRFIKRKSWISGFTIGVISSLVATLLFEYIFK